jgi:G3E family GTPase
MTLTTLVLGEHVAEREAAIAAMIDPAQVTVLILEGLPDDTANHGAFVNHLNLQIHRIASGCPCCTGNLVMRVTLNRILRQHPPRLFISCAATGHHDQIRRFIRHAPYDGLLTVTEDLYT